MSNNFAVLPWVLDTPTDHALAASPTGAVRSSNVVTITTSTLHGFAVGDKVVISSVTNTSFNGTFVIATVPSSTTFTFAQSGADATSGTGTASVHWQGQARINHIQFVGYTAVSHTAVLQDTNGNPICEMKGMSDLSNVSSEEIGWVQGLKLTTLDAGKIFVYIK